jgi:hypothetical protein
MLDDAQLQQCALNESTCPSEYVQVGAAISEQNQDSEGIDSDLAINADDATKDVSEGRGSEYFSDDLKVEAAFSDAVISSTTKEHLADMPPEEVAKAIDAFQKIGHIESSISWDVIAPSEPEPARDPEETCAQSLLHHTVRLCIDAAHQSSELSEEHRANAHLPGDLCVEAAFAHVNLSPREEAFTGEYETCDVEVGVDDFKGGLHLQACCEDTKDANLDDFLRNVFESLDEVAPYMVCTLPPKAMEITPEAPPASETNHELAHGRLQRLCRPIQDGDHNSWLDLYEEEMYGAVPSSEQLIAFVSNRGGSMRYKDASALLRERALERSTLDCGLTTA